SLSYFLFSKVLVFSWDQISDRLSAVASRDQEGFARDPGGVGGSKENRGTAYVARLPDAAERRLCFNLFAHLAFGYPGRMGAFRLHHAGPDGVDANSPRAKFRRQGTRDCVHRPFGGAINRSIRCRQSADHRTDVYNASAG